MRIERGGYGNGKIHRDIARGADREARNDVLNHD
jgi:hypothetical protein